MPALLRQEFARTFSRKLEDELDACHATFGVPPSGGPGPRKRGTPNFDGDRYLLGDCVVMPNHVHLLAGSMARDAMLKQVESWKKWTALQIHRAALEGASEAA